MSGRVEVRGRPPAGRVRSFGVVSIVVGVLGLAVGGGPPVAVGVEARAGAARPFAEVPVLADAPPGAGFTRTVDAGDDEVMHLALGVARDDSALHQVALAVSTPGSGRYGGHLDVAGAAATVDPVGTGRAVVAALADLGVHAWVDPTGVFVHATPTVAQVEAVFGVTVGRYRGPGVAEDIPFLAADQAPALPASLDGLVRELTGFTMALPSTTFPAAAAPSPPAADPPDPAVALPPAPTNTGTPQGCADAVGTGGYTQPQLATAYGMDAVGAPASRGAGAHVTILIDGDGLGADTVAAYRACFGVPASPTLTLVAPQDAPITSSAGELDVDVQTVLGLAPHLERLDVLQGVYGPNQWPLLFAAALDPAVTGPRSPDAVTLSDADCEATVPPAIVRLLDDVLAVYALVGTTVSLPAGDFGSATCPSEPGTSQIYPTTSPWVVAVGGTNMTLDTSNAIVEELVWNDNRYQGYDTQATGGGPSELFGRPVWQAGPGVVDPARGVPDVALFAAQYPGVSAVLDFGSGALWGPMSGTSFASPAFAAGVAMVDAQLEAAGRPRLGFVAPLLYQQAASGGVVTRDITEGSNDVDARGCCTAGPGYDLASGLGSVRFDALLAAALALPSEPAATPPPTSAATVPTPPAPAVASTLPSTTGVTLPATGPSDASGSAAGAGVVLVALGLALVAAARWRARRAGRP